MGLLLTFLALTPQEVDAEAKAELLKNGPPAWNAIESKWAGLVVRVHTKTRLVLGEDNSETEESSSVVKFDLPNHRALSVTDGSGGVKSISAGNGKYWFRVAQVEEDKHALQDGGLVSKQNPRPALQRIRGDGLLFFSASHLNGRPVKDILTNSKDYVWKSCSRLSDGTIRVELDVRGVWYNGSTFWIEFAKGTYVINRYGINFHGKNEGSTHETTITYGPEQPTGSVVKRAKVERLGADGVTGDFLDVTFEIESGGTVDEHEFELPHYGIPESAVYPPTEPIAWGKWVLIAVGAICLVAGVFLWRRQ